MKIYGVDSAGGVAGGGVARRTRNGSDWGALWPTAVRLRGFGGSVGYGLALALAKERRGSRR